MKLEWMGGDLFNWDSGLWVIQQHPQSRRQEFCVWKNGIWGNWQPIPEGLSKEEALQYMETIWRMEG